MKKIKIAKFITISVFLFSLGYTNKDRIPVPTELKTLDFITSSGIDIKLSDENENDIEFENMKNSEGQILMYGYEGIRPANVFTLRLQYKY